MVTDSTIEHASADPDLGLEISDLIVDYDASTLQRVEVRRDAVLDYFARRGNRRAQRIVRARWLSTTIRDRCGQPTSPPRSG